MFKRGDRVKTISDHYRTEYGYILGPEDFSGYDYNKPSDKWELVLWDSGDRTWIGKQWICVISV